ncbi:hypothetical protein SAMN07250955_11282 [Arboricoccus pini]|uniref:Uncharacterized protein n=1 Tax=Arboricoccus pini TaxID=1963835 RepID=A0A212RR56_9PROT|nr:hypothetical protein [Arboricoccus pini]SNB75045.1 hypothetical protein SAMN07250955_11282 [Arboricoccus pini]
MHTADYLNLKPDAMVWFGQDGVRPMDSHRSKTPAEPAEFIKNILGNNYTKYTGSNGRYYGDAITGISTIEAKLGWDSVSETTAAGRRGLDFAYPADTGTKHDLKINGGVTSFVGHSASLAIRDRALVAQRSFSGRHDGSIDLGHLRFFRRSKPGSPGKIMRYLCDSPR